jgi:intracellular septation protein
MDKTLKATTDFLPLVLFFIGYKISGLLTATMLMLVSNVICLGISFALTKRLAPMPIITSVVLVVFGSLTLYTGNSQFIKLKPTIINIMFAVILFVGIWLKKPLIKHVFNNEINLSDENWFILSKRWALFFFLLGVLNEVVWRTYPEDIWVKFKVFGMLGLAFVFTLSQIPFITRNRID